MSPGPLHVNEEDRFERPVPPEAPRADGKGGALKWAVAAVALFVFAGSVWYAYERGTRDAAGGRQPPLIKADPRPTKLRPDDPGGLDVPNRDKLVYERLITDQPDKRVERLLPPPEAPVDKPAPTADEAAGAPVSVGTTTVVPPQTMAAPKPPPNRSTTLKLSLDPATGEAKASASDAPVPAAPQATGSGPIPLTPSGTATAAQPPPPAVTPKPEASTPPADAEPPPKTEVASVPRASGYGVQLAALREKAGAPNEWRRLQAAFGSILGKRDFRLVRADLGKRGIFYRLVADGFADEAGARAACEALQALQQDCLVVELD